MAARDGAGCWHPVLDPVEPHEGGRLGGRRASYPVYRISQDPILGMIQQQALHHGLGIHALSKMAEVPCTVVHRILHAKQMRVIGHIQNILQAIGVRLFLMASTRPRPEMSHEVPVPVCRGSRPTARAKRARDGKPGKRSNGKRGVLSIGKAQVLQLAKEGLSCREIARGAGVCAERIRQILRTLGHAPAQLRRLKRMGLARAGEFG